MRLDIQGKNNLAESMWTRKPNDHVTGGPTRWEGDGARFRLESRRQPSCVDQSVTQGEIGK